MLMMMSGGGVLWNYPSNNTEILELSSRTRERITDAQAITGARRLLQKMGTHPLTETVREEKIATENEAENAVSTHTGGGGGGLRRQLEVEAAAEGRRRSCKYACVLTHAATTVIANHSVHKALLRH